MTYKEVLMPVASGFVCCPGMDECRVRMDALERPSRDTCTSLCVAGAGTPGAAIECVEMNWANFIGGGFLLGCGRSCKSQVYPNLPRFGHRSEGRLFVFPHKEFKMKSLHGVTAWLGI